MADGSCLTGEVVQLKGLRSKSLFLALGCEIRGNLFGAVSLVVSLGVGREAGILFLPKQGFWSLRQ